MTAVGFDGMARLRPSVFGRQVAVILIVPYAKSYTASDGSKVTAYWLWALPAV